MSLAFTKTTEINFRGGQSIINPSGKVFFRAANSRNSGFSTMEVIGSCVIPMALSPVDRVFRISFRIVRDLPYAVVLGAAFMKEHQRTMLPGEGRFQAHSRINWGAFLLAYYQLGDVIEECHRCLDCILRYSTNRR